MSLDTCQTTEEVFCSLTCTVCSVCSLLNQLLADITSPVQVIMTSVCPSVHLLELSRVFRALLCLVTLHLNTTDAQRVTSDWFYNLTHLDSALKTRWWLVPAAEEVPRCRQVGRLGHLLFRFRGSAFSAAASSVLWTDADWIRKYTGWVLQLRLQYMCFRAQSPPAGRRINLQDNLQDSKFNNRKYFSTILNRYLTLFTNFILIV